MEILELKMTMAEIRIDEWIDNRTGMVEERISE